jgi:hypothetical protein
MSLIEIGRCYGMVTNVGKKDNENLKSTAPSKFQDMPHTTAEYGIFQLSGNMINNAICTRDIKSRITTPKEHYTRRLSSPANWTSFWRLIWTFKF